MVGATRLYTPKADSKKKKEKTRRKVQTLLAGSPSVSISESLFLESCGNCQARCGKVCGRGGLWGCSPLDKKKEKKLRHGNRNRLTQKRERGSIRFRDTRRILSQGDCNGLAELWAPSLVLTVTSDLMSDKHNEKKNGFKEEKSTRAFVWVPLTQRCFSDKVMNSKIFKNLFIPPRITRLRWRWDVAVILNGSLCTDWIQTIISDKMNTLRFYNQNNAVIKRSLSLPNNEGDWAVSGVTSLAWITRCSCSQTMQSITK